MNEIHEQSMNLEKLIIGDNLPWSASPDRHVSARQEILNAVISPNGNGSSLTYQPIHCSKKRKNVRTTDARQHIDEKPTRQPSLTRHHFEAWVDMATDTFYEAWPTIIPKPFLAQGRAVHPGIARR